MSLEVIRNAKSVLVRLASYGQYFIDQGLLILLSVWFFWGIFAMSEQGTNSVPPGYFSQSQDQY